MIKRKTKTSKTGNFLALGFSVLLLVSLAQAEPQIRARLSSSNVPITGSVNLSVEVSGISNMQTPNLNIPNFSIHPAGRTQSQSWVNGKVSSLITYNYVLKPQAVGKFEIPSIILGLGSKQIKTEPIPVTVTGTASAQAQPSSPGKKEIPAESLKPVFLTAITDKKTAYVGEQILLTVQFHRSPQARITSQPQYTEPNMTGFLVESLKKRDYNTTIKGQPYAITEIRYALFPTSDGNFAIGGAHIELGVRAPQDPFDPNSFFQSFFGRSRLVKLDTRAIPIKIKPLPQNKPKNFSGAVGKYSLSATVDNTSPEVGKPLNLLVKIQGVGNIKTIKEPAFPDVSSFRRYETITDSTVDEKENSLYGTKTFKTLLIPQVSGQITLPSLSFVYFDPKQRRYVTKTSDPISLDVKAGTLSDAEQEFIPQTTPGQVTEGVRVVEKDIRFIKSGNVRPVTTPFYQQGTFFVLNALPPLFAAGIFLAGWQTKQRSLNPLKYRASGAGRKANKRLTQAKKNMKNTPADLFYGELQEAVVGFIADKFGLSPSGLIWDEVQKRLVEKKISPDLQDEIKSIFDEADMARFAPGSFQEGNRSDKLKQVQTVLDKLGRFL